MMLQRCAVACALVLSLSPLSLAQDAPKNEPLTLTAAIELALKSHPNLASANAQKYASEQRRDQAKTRFRPTVTAQSTYQEAYSESGISFVSGNTGTVQQTTVGRSQHVNQQIINGTLRIWDNGQRKLSLVQSEQAVKSSEITIRSTEQTIIGNVADNYFAILRNQALVSVNQAQVDRAKQLLDEVKARQEALQAAAKDHFQPEADLLNAQVNVLNAKNNVEISFAQFRNSIGVPDLPRTPLQDVTDPGNKMTLTAQFEPGKNESETIQKLIQMALEARPEVAQSRQTVVTNQVSRDIAKLGTQTTLSADIGMGYQFNSRYEPLARQGNNRSLNLNASYPIFDAGNARMQLRASEANIRASEAQLKSAEQQIAVDVEQAYLNLRQAQVTLPATRLAKEAAQINYEKASAQYKEGVGTITDVVVAQATLTQAETNYVQAIYNFYATDARLARALGQAERLARP
jgi:outer membrane protein TolC